MTKQVLILGATGQIAGHAITALLDETDAHLLLFTRHPQHLTVTDEAREAVIKGDTLDPASLDAAVAQADVVYANLRNLEIEQQAKNIVAAMDKNKVKQLVWISSIGIYDEVPGKFGEWNNEVLGGGQEDSYLRTYRKAADPAKYARKDLGVNKPHTDGDKPAWY